MLSLALIMAWPQAVSAADPTTAEALMPRLYRSDDAALLWRDRAMAAQALALLRGATDHGLDPQDYAADLLAARLAEARPHDKSLDRALSLAMLQLLLDIQRGRIAPDLRVLSQAESASLFDPVETLHQALRGGRLATALQGAAPQIPLYQRVRTSLQQYRALADTAPAWTTPAGLPASGDLTLTPKAALDLLRERLLLLGDLDGAHGESPGALEIALARFQSRHGLAETGRLDRATQDAMSVPLDHRVRQLELTLERLRWMPSLRPGRIIVVNIAAFRLWAFDTSSPATEPLHMKVIVGKAARTQTPLFIGQMRYLEFNPYWNVPPSIARGEIAPKLARNPSYLSQNDMEFVSASGQIQRTANADAIAALRAGTLRVRQRPGSQNVLGAVKFAMPNPMNIYLHSTAAKELFDKTRRDLSHGCIRVERPAELAQFVLAGHADWDAGSIAAAMEPGPMQRVALADAIPVVLFYATAATDRQGRAVFAEDIYRRDATLLRALAQRTIRTRLIETLSVADVTTPQ